MVRWRYSERFARPHLFDKLEARHHGRVQPVPYSQLPLISRSNSPVLPVVARLFFSAIHHSSNKATEQNCVHRIFANSLGPRQIAVPFVIVVRQYSDRTETKRFVDDMLKLVQEFDFAIDGPSFECLPAAQEIDTVKYLHAESTEQFCSASQIFSIDALGRQSPPSGRLFRERPACVETGSEFQIGGSPSGAILMHPKP